MTPAARGLAALAMGLVVALPAGADPEREVIGLVAGLEGASQAEREGIIAALAPHGALAVDVVLEFMQEGLLERPAALAAVAALQSGGPASADVPEGEAEPATGTPARGVDLGISTPASAPDDTLYHRVTGVADDDVLNIRDRAGVPGSTIIGSFAPDAEGIELVHGPDAHEIVSGGSWQKIRRGDLPDGTGWVNTRYLEPMIDAADAAFERMDRAAIAAEFVSGPGYEPLDTGIGGELVAELAGEDQAAFREAQRLAPPVQAILLLEAQDGVLPHARYRLRYGAERMPNPPGADPVTVSFIQIDRFNLGPARHAEIARGAGDAAVPPASRFGDGPHVSWRIVSAPIQRVVANLNAVSRAEFADDEAAGARCLDIDCLSLDSAAAAVPHDWQADEEIAFAVERVFETVRDGAHSPAAVMEMLFAQSWLLDGASGDWRGAEPREGVEFAQPFLDVVIESGLAQEIATEGVLRDGHLMDDELAALWWHVASIGSGDPRAPVLFAAEARQRHEWRE